MITEALTMDSVVVFCAGTSTIVSLGTSLWTILTSRSRQNGERIDALEARQALSERSISQLIDKVDAMPDREMVHRLELGLVKIEGSLGRLEERMQPIGAIAERMQELMLQEGRGR